MKDKMWVYLIQLGENMWGEPGDTSHKIPYQPELTLDECVWKNTIDFLGTQGFNTVLIDIGDGIQYERHPEISIRGAWPKDKLKKELERIREMGLTPLPKLNFSATHDAWLGDYGRMITTPLYYQVCKDCIEEVAELFGYPKYFHLGMNEEVAKYQKHSSLSYIRHGELWWHDLYYLFDVCEKVGARPWIWADKVWYEPEEFFEKMPKSILLSNYYYMDVKKLSDGTYTRTEVNAFCQLEEHKYEQLPCMSYCLGGYPLNAIETMEVGKEQISSKRLLGYMTAPWHKVTDIAKYSLLNDAYRFIDARRIVYPEV